MIWRPALVLAVVAPYLGEVLSTATPVLDFLLPWRLALLAALYGGGALLCREVAVRFWLGSPGSVLLGAAYGVYEEGLVDRFWFDPGYAHDTGIGSYAEVAHTNLILAVHLTAFHAAVSVGSSVVIVTRLFPGARDRPWLNRPALVVVTTALLAVPFLTYDSYVRPTGPQSAIALGALVGFVGLAFLIGDRRRRRSSRPRLLSVLLFFVVAAQFVLTYAVAATGLAWPVGLAVTVVPIALAAALVPRLDERRTVTAVLGFFVFDDLFVGLAGRYDLIVTAGLTAAALLGWNRRVRPGDRRSVDLASEHPDRPGDQG